MTEGRANTPGLGGFRVQVNDLRRRLGDRVAAQRLHEDTRQRRDPLRVVEVVDRDPASGLARVRLADGSVRLVNETQLAAAGLTRPVEGAARRATVAQVPGRAKRPAGARFPHDALPVGGGLYAIYLRAEGNSLVVYANPIRQPGQWIELQRFENRFCSFEWTKEQRIVGSTRWSPSYNYGMHVQGDKEEQDSFDVIFDQFGDSDSSELGSYGFRSDETPILDSQKDLETQEANNLFAHRSIEGSSNLPADIRCAGDLYYDIEFITIDPSRPNDRQRYIGSHGTGTATQLAVKPTTSYGYCGTWVESGLSYSDYGLFPPEVSSNSWNYTARAGGLLNNQNVITINQTRTQEFFVSYRRRWRSDQLKPWASIEIRDDYVPYRIAHRLRDVALSASHIPGQEIILQSQDTIVARYLSPAKEGNVSDAAAPESYLTGMVPGMALSVAGIEASFTYDSLHNPEALNGAVNVIPGEVTDSTWQAIKPDARLTWDPTEAKAGGVSDALIAAIGRELSAAPGAVLAPDGTATVPYRIGRKDWELKSGDFIPLFVTYLRG